MTESLVVWYPEVVIYHTNCFDGVGSAWVCMKLLDDHHADRKLTNLIPMGHNSPYVPDEVEGKRVLMVDYAYGDEKLMTDLCDKASAVVVLDHHKTSLQYKNFVHPKFTCIIDMDRSGAQLAWDYLMGTNPRPPMIDYIGERDLWKFTLPNIHETICYVYSNEATIEWLDDVYAKWNLQKYAGIGSELKNDRDSIVNVICKSFYKSTFTDNEKVYNVMVGDCCWIFRSDVGNKLMEDNPDIDFVLLYSYSVNSKIFNISLRGKNKVDLSALAKQYGGGGHPNASGMNCSNLDFLTFLSPMHQTATTDFDYSNLNICSELKANRDSNVKAICKNFYKSTFTDNEKVYNVMAGDCCWIFRGDVGNKLMEDNPDMDFALLYSYSADSKIFNISLRGKNKVDLSKQCGVSEHPNEWQMKCMDFLTFLPYTPDKK
jgi:uncharacterized protein